jgi:hypothetical protein
LLKEEIYSNGNLKHILIFLFKYLFHTLHCYISGYWHKVYIISQITTFVTVVYSVWCDGNIDSLMAKLLGWSSRQSPIQDFIKICAVTTGMFHAQRKTYIHTKEILHTHVDMFTNCMWRPIILSNICVFLHFINV